MGRGNDNFVILNVVKNDTHIIARTPSGEALYEKYIIIFRKKQVYKVAFREYLC